MGFIYKITNKINKKCYIGQTIMNIEKRWDAHRKCIGTENGCPGLRRAFEKYGLENFKFEIVIVCFDTDLSKYEKEYIIKYDSYKNGYNLTHGGEEGGFFKGCKHTPENVEKIKQRWVEYNANPANRKLRSDRMLAKYADPKNREEQSKRMKAAYAKIKEMGTINRNYYKTLSLQKSEEVKQKIRESVLKYYKNIDYNIHSEKYKNHSKIMTEINGRKVSQYSLTGEFIKTYDSIKIAGIQTNGSFKAIGHVLRGRKKTSGGFIWKYADTPSITS